MSCSILFVAFLFFSGAHPSGAHPMGHPVVSHVTAPHVAPHVTPHVSTVHAPSSVPMGIPARSYAPPVTRTVVVQQGRPRSPLIVPLHPPFQPVAPHHSVAVKTTDRPEFGTGGMIALILIGLVAIIAIVVIVVTAPRRNS